MNTEREYRGNHFTADFQKCFIKQKNLEAFIIISMNNFRQICDKNGLNIVGEKVCYYDGSKSPVGASFVFILDESHISFHLYAEEGILAIDVFTCSKKPENHFNACNDICNYIKLYCVGSEEVSHQHINRFPFK